MYRVEDLGMLGIAEWTSIIKDVWKPYSQAHSRAVSALAYIAGNLSGASHNSFLLQLDQSGRFGNKLQQICTIPHGFSEDVLKLVCDAVSDASVTPTPHSAHSAISSASATSAPQRELPLQRRCQAHVVCRFSIDDNSEYR